MISEDDEKKRPYKCDQCDERFSQIQNINDHKLKQHTGIFLINLYIKIVISFVLWC